MLLDQLLSAIPQALMAAVSFIAGAIFNALAEPLEQQTAVLLTYPAPLASLFPLWTTMVQIVALASVAAVTCTGLYLLLSGSGPEGRERTKNALEDIIMTAFLVSISFLLYVLINDAASAMSSAVWQVGHNAGMVYRPSGAAEMIFLGPFYLLGVLFLNMTLGFRVILVMAGVALFPVGLALMRFPWLRGWGHGITNGLAMLMFLPVVDAILIIAASAALQAAGGALGGLVAMAAYWLVALANMKLIMGLFGSASWAAGRAAGAAAGRVVAVVGERVDRMDRPPLGSGRWHPTGGSWR